MEIHHKIRPRHGWRDFFGEVGIIVIGVMLALAAEQVVEALHWRHRVALGREALAGDLASIIYNARERELYSKCLSRRLGDIADILDKAQRTGRLPPVGPLGGPSSRPYSLVSWTALGAAGLATHLPHKDVLSYSSIADLGNYASNANINEFAIWSRLYAISGPGRPIGEAELGQLRADLSQAAYHAKFMRLLAFQLEDAIRKGRLPVDEDQVRENDRELTARKPAIASATICRPLGPAAARYGDSPLNYSLDGPRER